jgi:hypothetical protein
VPKGESETVADLQPVLAGVLIVLGMGFLVVNVRLWLEYRRYRRRRSRAVLTWPGPRPPYFALQTAMGITLGFLAFYKFSYLHRQVFGETMMFVYYAYMVPLSRRIGRGFYEDGIWADSGFIPYEEVGGVTWREGEHQATLIVISRLKALARRLVVPGDSYGAARRVLRDKIAAHAIQFAGQGLELLEHDERMDV